MTRPVNVVLQWAYQRRSLFALELLDGVTLSRVSQGVAVVAEGLRSKPVVNSSGLFVWRKGGRVAPPLDGVGPGDFADLRKISVDPGRLPYEQVDLALSQLTLPPAARPLTTIELIPRVDYPFPPGVTAGRGMLIEEHVLAPQRPIPVPGAEVHVRWLDEDAVTWRDAPLVAHTTDRGDFVAVVRLATTDMPHVDGNGAVSVRLRIRRQSGDERATLVLRLPQGRVADPSTLAALTLAWDELQP